ncbi:MAG: organic solvent tolerance protein OstA [Bacteroidetes bacterium]|nr:MAG: organic solvent tolerance protein OstA [Bacteroidota bacterium]
MSRVPVRIAWSRAGAVLLVLLVAAGGRPARAQVPDSMAAASSRDTTRAVREVELLHADELRKQSADTLELVGDVRLRQGETGLRAGRALELIAQEAYLFLGDVVIVERGDTLRALRVRYDHRHKVGDADGGVVLSDGDVVVRAPSGRYYTDEKRAVFEEGVTLVDSASVLTSRAGSYWSDAKRAVFFDQVRLTGDRTFLEADTVVYFRETEVADARGRVFIERLGGDEDAGAAEDSTTRTFLFGARAYNDNRAAFSRIEGRPLLVQLRADSSGALSDTLLVRAERLEIVRQDSLQRLIAVGDVQIWQPEFAAAADSVVYERRTRAASDVREETRLFGRPAAWFDTSQATGDTLRITARGGALDTLFITGQAFVARRDTLLDRLSQLKGRTITGLFVQDTLRTLLVGPNAEAIHYLRNEDTDDLGGAVQASADRIVFDLEGDGELRDIRFYRGVEGTYFDAGQIPEALRLDGFRWEPERRPRPETLFPATWKERLDRHLNAPAGAPVTVQGTSG